jgi:acetyltransferase-like isoleucine patch superfamily enzyme
MMLSKMNDLKFWIKTSDDSIAQIVKKLYQLIRLFEIPSVPILHKTIYIVHKSIAHFLSELMRIFYWTPVFKSRLMNSPSKLYLFGGMPVVMGSLNIIMGDEVRLSGVTTLSGRSVNTTTPVLTIGNNVGIGWSTTISVGNKVTFNDNVRIASNCHLAGYPGHPINAKDRAKGMSDTDEQVGNITLEKDVWLATGVSVMSGVTIGEGTIVAASSVVTHDLPSHVLAGGIPAKVIKKL